MRAAVGRSFGARLELAELRLRAPGPGEVLIRVAACGGCHSDIAFIDGAWGGALPAVVTFPPLPSRPGVKMVR